ncbi:MAG TPA: ATP-binding protein, partial [Gemmatimonadaceae bacterium]
MKPAIAILSVGIKREEDVLLARGRGREIGKFLGFSTGDLTRVTTALSEIARNAFEYGGGGRVTFAVESQSPGRQALVIRVIDQGPGIPDVDAVLSPDFHSRTGMGIGVRGSKGLMDSFTITSTNGHGTTVTMAKALPWSERSFGANDAERLAAALAASVEATPLGEMQSQNQVLLNTLQELTERQAEVERL